jgi:integrase/recombinase XerC
MPVEMLLAPPIDMATLCRDWLSSLTPRSREAYSRDLADFAAFLGATTGTDALRSLVEQGQAFANVTALRYRTHLQERKLSPATVNRRLAALRSAVGIVRVAGIVPWALEVKPLRNQKYRDVRGPGVSGIRSLLRATGDGTTAKSLRDRALILLLFGMGLRRGEVVSLDVEHFEASGKRLHVSGKGRGGEREALTVPAPAFEALKNYLATRGNPAAGPLFLNLDHSARGGGRLTGDGIRRILRELGEVAGLGVVRPHGLRHAAITAALDAGRDVREVLKFSRHKDPRTLIHYDDSRKDHGGEVASVVSSLLS